MKSETLDNLLRTLQSLRQDLIEVDRAPSVPLDELSPTFRESARNLLLYLALRRHDLRDVQERLTALGMSSLGRAEASTLANLQAVLRLVGLLAERGDIVDATPALGLAESRQLLENHTRTLLGPPVPKRPVRIMVTMPGEAANDYPLVRDLLREGMDCVRINCAHDDRDVWERIIANLRRAEKELGRKCRVLMDLGGPKLRTGPMPPGPQIVKWRPRRDVFGNVEAPALVWLTAAEQRTLPPAPADAVLPVPRDWLAALREGDRIQFHDARGAKRKLAVVEATPQGCWAESHQTAYVMTGTRLRCKSRPNRPKAIVADLPEKPIRIHLTPGDELIVSRDAIPGAPTRCDSSNGQMQPARIGCTLPEVFASVLPGEAIWLDDGRIGGIVHGVETDELHIEITHTPPGGAWLAADKGINLPDTKLGLPPLTFEDLANLPFVAAHADLVGYSFVRDAAGIAELLARLKECGGANHGIVLKIETRLAFEHLPELLLAAMRGPSVGVMIARGDLAVECGFERLAEVQEEILWLSEAAHVPVIWATQVLENLAKTGFPSRAEITDAAMGERAECVMLNKGPHILEAVRLLDGILRRMHGHQSKKRSMMRSLNVANLFPKVAEVDAMPK